MNKSITLMLGVLLAALVARAQETPRWEAFLGYNYTRTDLESSNIPGLNHSFTDSFSMHGGDAQFIYNFGKVFSGVVDLGAVHKANLTSFNLDDTRSFFMAGPRLSYRRSSRWSPYFEILFGASERSASKQLSVVTGPDTPEIPVVTPHGPLFPGPGVEVTAKVSASQTDFSLATGGGLDVRLSKRLTFRPIAVDYVLTTFPSLLTGRSNSQNGLRATVGFIFTAGAR